MLKTLIWDGEISNLNLQRVPRKKILIELEVSTDLGPIGLETKVDNLLKELNTRTVTVLKKEIKVYNI